MTLKLIWKQIFYTYFPTLPLYYLCLAWTNTNDFKYNKDTNNNMMTYIQPHMNT